MLSTLGIITSSPKKINNQYDNNSEKTQDISKENIMDHFNNNKINYFESENNKNFLGSYYMISENLYSSNANSLLKANTNENQENIRVMEQLRVLTASNADRNNHQNKLFYSSIALLIGFLVFSLAFCLFRPCFQIENKKNTNTKKKVISNNENVPVGDDKDGDKKEEIKQELSKGKCIFLRNCFRNSCTTNFIIEFITGIFLLGFMGASSYIIYATYKN